MIDHVEVKTNVFPDGIIEQETIFSSDNPARNVRQIMNTQIAQVREALIALGWTPPTDT